MDEVKPARRSVHRTQWAAQFAVASELCKRNYEVAFTMGNHPSVDIMVKSPNGVAFGIDVKGLYKKNFWVVKPKLPQDDLYYVFAFVPDNSPNEFFILTQAQVNMEVELEFEAARERAKRKGRSTEKVELFPCIPWKEADKFRAQWKNLPG